MHIKLKDIKDEALEIARLIEAVERINNKLNAGMLLGAIEDISAIVKSSDKLSPVFTEHLRYMCSESEDYLIERYGN